MLNVVGQDVVLNSHLLCTWLICVMSLVNSICSAVCYYLKGEIDLARRCVPLSDLWKVLSIWFARFVMHYDIVWYCICWKWKDNVYVVIQIT